MTLVRIVSMLSLQHRLTLKRIFVRRLLCNSCAA